MTFRNNLRTIAIGFGASLLAAQAHAIPIAIAIAKTDVTIQNSAGAFVSSSAAALGKGTIKKNNVNALTGLFAGDSWSLLDQTNTRSTKFKNMNFLLTADVRRNSGQWGLQWAGTNFPDYMDYVLVLKSGRQWGAYLLDGSSLPDSKKLSGTFSMPWVINRGRGTKQRFASIYGRVGKAPVSLPVTDGGSSGGGGGNNGGSGGDNGSGSGSDNGSGGSSGGGDNSGSGVETIVSVGGPGLGEDTPSSREINAVSTPGSFALLAMGLGLILTHLRRKPQTQGRT